MLHIVEQPAQQLPGKHSRSCGGNSCGTVDRTIDRVDADSTISFTNATSITIAGCSDTEPYTQGRPTATSTASAAAQHVWCASESVGL